MTSLGNDAANYFMLRMSSNFVNVANFVIFDVTLIALVYCFTAEITGRLNAAEISDGNQKRLFIFCPPLLGGGLCSTIKFRLYFFMCIRLLAFLLILAANLTINGAITFPVETRKASVLTFGAFQNLSTTKFKEYLEKRRRCKGTYNRLIYYGEIRNGKCERKEKLLLKPVYFDIALISVKIQDPSENSSCKSNDLKDKSSIRSRTRAIMYRCPKATIVCLSLGYIRPENCRGLVQARKKTLLCDTFGFATRENRGTWEGKCASAYNLDWIENNWAPVAQHTYHWTIFDAVDAASVAREETKVVSFEKQQPENVTIVEYYWLVVLGGKVVLVLSLGITNFLLWRAGHVCLANDENTLFDLLLKSVHRFSNTNTDRKVYLNQVEKLGKVQFWASSSPAEGLKGFAEKRKNEQQHKIEEMLY